MNVLADHSDRVAFINLHEYMLTISGLGPIPQRILEDVAATEMLPSQAISMEMAWIRLACAEHTPSTSTMHSPAATPTWSSPTAAPQTGSSLVIGTETGLILPVWTAPTDSPVNERRLPELNFGEPPSQEP